MGMRYGLLGILCCMISACALPVREPSRGAAAVATVAPSVVVGPTSVPHSTPGKVVRPAVVPTRTLAPVPRARYASAPCRFAVPENTAPVCGYLSVPEERTDPQSRTIRLHVAVFKSTSEHPQPDPVVYLDGGPGGNPLETIRYVFDDWFGPIVAKRDVVIVDQRGTGLSEPALDCIEMRELGYDLLAKHISREESRSQEGAALQRCHDRLTGIGIHLSAYTSAANAADLADLRTALGYDEWNLYGISYGTRLALTALRDTPTGIRSVILDSTYPPQAALYTDLPANAERSFDLLFTSCAQDAACDRAFPNLKQAFLATVDRLQTSPVTVATVDPFTGKNYDVLLDGDGLINTLFQMLYQTSALPELPKLLYDAYQDKSYERLANEAAFGVFSDELFSVGMYYAIQCGEEVPFSSRQEIAAASKAFPDLRGAISDESIVDRCAVWDVRAAAPRENEPVRSDLPVLILAGQFDPITPPNYGQEVADTLDHSFFFTFPGIGHGASVDDPCPRGILLAFLDDPTVQPNDSCIARMPALHFVTP